LRAADHRLPIGSRGQESERDRDAGAVLADRAVHEHGLVDEHAPHHREHLRGGVVDDLAVEVGERGIPLEERRDRPEVQRHALGRDVEPLDATRRVVHLVVVAEVDDAPQAHPPQRGRAVLFELRQVARAEQHARPGATGAGGQAPDVAEVQRTVNQGGLGHAEAAGRGSTG
jgi:hypothetical protein